MKKCYVGWCEIPAEFLYNDNRYCWAHIRQPEFAHLAVTCSGKDCGSAAPHHFKNGRYYCEKCYPKEQK